VTDNNSRVVAFACRWTLGEESKVAGGAKLIPVLCSGRVSPGFVLQAFEWGADGVLVAGCGTEDCRYIFGAKQQEAQFGLVREVTKVLGIEDERLRLAWVEGPEELETVAADFVATVTALGPSPAGVTPDLSDRGPEVESLREISRAFACIDCGKCTGFCPVSRYTETYSPHRIVGQSVFKETPEKEIAEAVWGCFTCGLCERRCPAGVKYATLQQGLRRRARSDGDTGRCAHGGALLGLMRLHANSDLPQDRLGWVPEGAEIAEKGETALFVGCAPYFDAFFEHMKVKTTDATKGSLKLLNAMGVTPVVMHDEVCCGHDLLWGGDRENFERLARKNVENLKARGVEHVVFPCAECYRTVTKDWLEVLGELPFTTAHIAETVAESSLEGNGTPVKATIQDPCRLTRHMKKETVIRDALAKAGSVEVTEMMRHGLMADCCGSSSWVNCGAGTAALQEKRLSDAKATGADVLLTACPKCEIHLSCSQLDKDGAIKIENVASVLAEALVKAPDAAPDTVEAQG
jgi:Fe-S oxidoreductase/coenzyme F420-reducing hydrogenase delta subunit